MARLNKKQCARWLRHPDEDPREPGKKIRYDGNTHRSIAEACKPVLSSGVCRRAAKAVATKHKDDVCALWRQNPTVDPAKRTPIRVGGRVFQQLEKLCGAAPVATNRNNKNQAPTPALSKPAKSPPKTQSPKATPANNTSSRSQEVLQKVDAAYLAGLQREAEMLEQAFTVEQLEKDIGDDEFIRKAVEAHYQALQFKLKTYAKLQTIQWQGGGGGGVKQESKANINTVLQAMSANISKQLSDMQVATTSSAAAAAVIADKRRALQSILYDPDDGIATIQGKARADVRTNMIKIMYTFIRAPQFFFSGFINFMFMGSAGSGKTKVAMALAHMFTHLGLMATRTAIIATRKDLVGQYLGETSIKTYNLLVRALEGVLFIDEAYTLTPCPGAAKDEYAEQAVGELINFMDKFKGCLVIVVAGYKGKMQDCFMAFNEGMPRRFPSVMELLPYTSSDLYNILQNRLQNKLTESNKALPSEQWTYIGLIIAKLNQKGAFMHQASDMETLADAIYQAIVVVDNYTNDNIRLTFRQFFAKKGYKVDHILEKLR